MPLLRHQTGKFGIANHLIGEDVAFSGLAPIYGRQCSGGQVAYVAQIEGAIDRHRHIALHLLQDAGGGLAHGHVTGAKNAAWLHHTGVETFLAHCIQNSLGGDCFGLAVGAHHLVRVKVGDFLHGLSFGQFRNGSGAAHIDQFFTFRMGQALCNDVFRAAHIDVHDQF